MPTPSLIPPPYKTLEAVRGLAATWVVCFHATLLMSLAHPFISTLPAIGILKNGYLGVQVFFVVSGYCIASAACSTLAKPRPIWAFAVARCRRIFPPMWASLAIIAAASLLATWLVAHKGFDHTSLADIDLPHRSLPFYLTNLTLTQLAWAFPHHPNAAFLSEVCWTLCYEMAFYFLVALTLAIILIRGTAFPGGVSRRSLDPDKIIRTLLTTLHLITLTCLTLLIISPQSIPYPFDLWPQFGLGVAVFDIVRHRKTQNSWRPWTFLLLIIAGFLIFLCTQSLRIGQTQQPSIDTFSAALAAALILLACHSFDTRLITLPPIRLLAFIGTFSYSLYLVNFLLIAGMMILYKRLYLPDAAHLPAILAIVLLVLPLSYTFFLLFEKPFLKSRKKPAPSAPLTNAPGQAPLSPITTSSSTEN